MKQSSAAVDSNIEMGSGFIGGVHVSFFSVFVYAGSIYTILSILHILYITFAI